MKKFSLLLSFFLIASSAAHASVDGRTTRGPVARPLMMMSRGLMNVAGFPAEISSTVVREIEIHEKSWPVFYPLRLVTNVFVRLSSGINDVLFMPFIVPFTDDISPITEPMGLPEYPWQIG